MIKLYSKPTWTGDLATAIVGGELVAPSESGNPDEHVASDASGVR